MSFFKRVFLRNNTEILSKEDFGIELISIAREEFSEYQYQLGDIAEEQPYFLILSHENEEYSRVHYGEIYEEYLNNPTVEVRQTVLANYAESLRELISGLTLEVFVRQTNIMPVIKPISWLKKYAEAEGKSLAECSMVSFPLDFDNKGDLCVVFAFDDGEHYIYVNKSLVPHFEPSTFFAVVKQNLIDYLMHHLQAETFSINEESIGCMIRTDGEYESSLVILMDDISKFLKLKGSPVIALLAKDILIVADSANSLQIGALKESAENLIEELDNPLSSQLYYLTDDQKVLLYDFIH